MHGWMIESVNMICLSITEHHLLNQYFQLSISCELSQFNNSINYDLATIFVSVAYKFLSERYEHPFLLEFKRESTSF